MNLANQFINIELRASLYRISTHSAYWVTGRTPIGDRVLYPPTICYYDGAFYDPLISDKPLDREGLKRCYTSQTKIFLNESTSNRQLLEDKEVKITKGPFLPECWCTENVLFSTKLNYAGYTRDK